MFVHNRMGLMMVGAAFMLFVFAGAGCGSREKEGAPEKVPSTPDDASAADAGGAITNWTTYRSDALGIAIPYPEGWYPISMGSRGDTEFFAENPVENSESSSRVYLAVSNRPVATEIDYPNRLNVFEELHSGVSMIKLTFLVDADFPEEVTAAYLWERGGTTYRLVGTEGDAVLRYMVDHLEVMP